MIRVTSSAVNKVKRLLAERRTPDLGLRLGIQGGGCSGLSYVMDFVESPEATDLVIECDGLRVFIDPKSAGVLAEVELDYVEGIQDHGFHFRNPNAKSTCGCGVSFSV
jgi:iron-sulfur cluster assembly protein